jgi:hypothetical protein
MGSPYAGPGRRIPRRLDDGSMDVFRSQAATCAARRFATPPPKQALSQPSARAAQIEETLMMPLFRRRFRFSLLAPVAVLLAFALALGGGCSASKDTTAAGGNSSAGGGGGAAGPTSGSGASDVGGSISIGSGGTTGFEGDPVTCADAATAHTYIGCDYWPTVTANNVWSIFDYAVIVANAGMTPADVTVTRGGQMVAQVTVPPDQLSKIYLPWVPALKGADFDECTSYMPFQKTVRANGGAYHLVTTTPVTVYQFSALEYAGQGGPPGKNWGSCPGNDYCAQFNDTAGCFSFSNDASLLLPSTAMTGNYRLISAAGSQGAILAVTGTQDGTKVTVTASATATFVAGGGINGASPGGKTTFTLDAGDVVELAGSDNADLGGTLVQADKAVQVIGGHPCQFSPLNDQEATCDHLEESVLPAETLGKHYIVTVPTGPHGKPVGHVVSLFGNVNGTKLTYPSGQPNGAPSALDAGQVVNLGTVSKDFEVEGDHEFGVATLMLSANHVDPNEMIEPKGDPSISQSTAVEQYRTKYIFLAPSDYDVSYVDVVAPIGAHLLLDGQSPDATPTPLGSTFAIVRIQLGAGNGGAHVLTATAPVGIQVLGYGSYTSYQYPGGSNLVEIAAPPE